MHSETEAFKNAKNILLRERSKRIRPALDHKIILSWNNLMIVGLCKAYAAIGAKSYKQQAIQAMQWLEENMYNSKEGHFFHTHTSGVNKSNAFLEDYASLIQAYIHLQEITGDTQYLYKAKQWTDYTITHFRDEEGLFFYFTPAVQKDILVRKKENYDGAQPSGNALMSYNLLYLGTQFSIPEWTVQAQKMVQGMRKMILQYPSSFSIWAQSFMLIAMDFTHLVGVGPRVQMSISEVIRPFLPLKMLLFIPAMDPQLSWSVGKELFENQYFICKDGSCSAPFSNLKDYLAII
jgi:uncharacterized protein YyaL (SSP411 family)